MNGGECLDNRVAKVSIGEGLDRAELFGSMDSNVKIIKEYLDVEMVQRGDDVIVSGPDAESGAKALRDMMSVIEGGERLDSQKVNYIMVLTGKGLSYADSNIDKDIICYTQKGKPLKAKTMGQASYVDAIRKKDIVFGIGPAGTGKTYLAVAMAVSAYKRKEVEKIILTRPAVEAGERLGFLPGDLQEKVDPYLRPLYDALYDVLGRDSTMRLKEKEVIEIVPLAYMRGRTLDNSFIILDEAQNTTREQMKMFLTRMGFGSKVVVTGDVTQVDLPRGKKSGLTEAAKILRSVKGISFCYLKDVDVVRHQLVKRIIGAYDRYYKENPEPEEEQGRETDRK